MCECRAVLETLMATSLAPMPGVEPLLDELQAAQVPIAVATSGTRQYAQDVLSRLHLLQCFRFILTADDITRGKPDPEVYLLAAERLSLTPPQMMALEDSANGCRAAVAAGAFVVAVPNRHTRDHSFAGARLIADTLADPRIRRALKL
jgi:HAD superfamily hydrolase (TIGR01509 family)